MITLKVDSRQLATVLAALRYYQNDMDDDRLSPDVDPEGALHNIATDGGTHEALSVVEIDSLCEQLNS